jgi:hypothetical protein
MSSFENFTRGNFDMCPANKINTSIHDYNMMSYRPETGDDFIRFVSENRNLQYTDGNGMSSKLVDIDSAIKNDIEATHDKTNRQLSIRNFVAGPNLGKGESIPTLEHVLQSGENTSICGSVREVMYKKPPLNASTANMITGNNMALNKWNVLPIGKSSKDILKAIRHR